MSPAHKQRVIGAVVLVALGLIIVPAVLDFSRDEHADMKGMEIPPGPDAMQMEVLPLEEWSQKVEPGVARQEQSGEAVESTEPPETTPDQIEAAVPAVPVPQKNESRPAPAPLAPVAPVAKPAPAPVTTAAPKAETVAKGEGWVVQVASLTVEAKANELRDQLRKAGHPAFIERGKSGGGDIYRVKAGPVAQRAEADELKRKVKQITGLEGLVRQNQ